MVYVAAAVLVFTIAAFLFVMHKNSVLAHHEREGLYQRIQAPQQAVASAIAQDADTTEKLYVAPDDDKGWEDYMQALRKE